MEGRQEPGDRVWAQQLIFKLQHCAIVDDVHSNIVLSRDFSALIVVAKNEKVALVFLHEQRPN
jgi:hypothetical protein